MDAAKKQAQELIDANPVSTYELATDGNTDNFVTHADTDVFSP